MKRFFILFLIVAAFWGCDKNSNIDSNKKINFAYSFEPGKKYHYEYVKNDVQTIMIQTDTLQADSIERNLTYNFDVVASAKDKNNEFDLTINFTNIKYNQKAAKQSVDFNTDDSKTFKKEFASYQALINMPVAAKVNDKGEILSIGSVDSIINKYVKLIEYKAQLKPEEKAEFQNRLKENEIRALLETIARKLPKNEIKADSIWIDPQPTIQLGPYNMNNSITYQIVDIKNENNKELIKVTGKFNISATPNNQTTIEQQGAKISYKEPKLSSNGNFVYNSKAGIIESTDGNMELSSEIVQEAAGKTASRKEMLRSKYSLKLK